MWTEGENTIKKIEMIIFYRMARDDGKQNRYNVHCTLYIVPLRLVGSN